MNIFKSFIENQRAIFSKKVDINPIETSIDILLSEIESKKNILKSSFDNQIIDLDQYYDGLGILKSQEDELKGKKQDYADVILLNTKGDVLLLRRSISDTFYPDCWCLPGGKIENGETPIQAALRELEEETNIKIHNVEKIFEKKISNGIIHYFISHILEDDQILDSTIILDSSEHIGWCFADINKRKELNLLLDLEETLDNIVGDFSQLNFKLFPVDSNTGMENSLYSNEEERIANNSPNKPDKDILMLSLFKNNDISSDEYINYIEKSYKEEDNSKKIILEGKDKVGNDIKKWVTKNDLKQLAELAKNSPKTSLEETINNHSDPTVRVHAHKEIKRREDEEEIKEETLNASQKAKIRIKKAIEDEINNSQ